MIRKLLKQERFWTAVGLMLPIVLLLTGLTFDRAVPSQVVAYAGGGSAGAVRENDGRPREVSPLVPAGAGGGGGGTAQSSEAASGSGAGKGTAEPPTNLPAAQAIQPNAEQDSAEVTPNDPSAPQRVAPFVPPTVPRDLPGSGSNGPASPSSASSLIFWKNVDLGSGGNIIGETTAASGDNVVLETWNAYGAVSGNNGISWTYYNPSVLFNWPGNDFGGFCCDQIA